MATNSSHTPTPLAFRISANGRDFEITAPTLRPEWVGSDMQSQPVVIAKVWCGDWTDATGSARALNEANASFIVEACNGYAALQSQNAELVKALRGEYPEAPEIGPLSWLKSAIAELRRRKPADDDDDPSAYWEMVNELEAFHVKASAALASLSAPSPTGEAK